MDAGKLAALIAAAFFALGVCAGCYVLYRLARLISATTDAVRGYQAGADELMRRAQAAVDRADQQLAQTGALVGGHRLLPLDFRAGLRDADEVRICTYDGWVSATWRWVMDRVVCAFGLHWEAPVMPAGRDVGIDALAGRGWVTPSSVNEAPRIRFA